MNIIDAKAIAKNLRLISNKLTAGKAYSKKQNTISSNAFLGIIISDTKRAFSYSGDEFLPSKYFLTDSENDIFDTTRIVEILNKFIVKIESNKPNNHFLINQYESSIISQIKRELKNG